MASCTASSHTSNCPYRRVSAPRTCGASSRSRPSKPSSVVKTGRLVHDLADLDRTFGKRHDTSGYLECARLVLHVDDPVPSQGFLGLGKRAIRYDRHAIAELDGFRLSGIGQALS